MSNKKSNVILGLRIIFMVVLQALLYRNEKIDVFFTAVSLTAICFWILPWCFTNLIFYIFKIKDDFGGTLEFDDSDPTDCRFKMIFNVDPEDLAKEPTFTVECKRTDLKSIPVVDPRKEHRS